MKEQSHKDEMSKALRGDFERLRERGVSATLAPRAPAVAPQEPEVVSVPELAPDVVVPEQDGVAGDRPLRGQSPSGDELPEQDGVAEGQSPSGDEPPEQDSVAGDDTMSRPGLFARLIGR